MKGRTGKLFALVLLVLVIGAACAISQANQGSSPAPVGLGPSATSAEGAGATTAALGQRTKTEGCGVGGGLSDGACTPGAVFPNVTRVQICVAGYAKSVRNVPEAEKREVYAEYGIRTHLAGAYEVDHLVSLELGGSNDISNLWPEAAEPRPGFHEKDRYENFAHDQVCRGEITLQEAQRRIAENWIQYWSDAGKP